MEKYQIHKAALESDYESALKLISFKVDLNELDINGHTALHWAVFRGDLEFVNILLEAGANPNVFSSDGVTPKWRARDFGLVEIDKLLDSFGGKVLTNEHFDRIAFSVFNNLIGQTLPEEDAAEQKKRTQPRE
ncbi:MAG: ankyrin repeat domain-containing protein [Ferruginibacter sp.]